MRRELKKMTTLLTVDWGFFVPEERLMWNEFVETKYSFNDKWFDTFATAYAYNLDLEERIKTTGEEIGFWDRLRSKFIIPNHVLIKVTESHVDAFDFARKYEVDRIFCFDSHVDLGSQSPKEIIDYSNAESNLNVYCVDWLGGYGVYCKYYRGQKIEINVIERSHSRGFGFNDEIKEDLNVNIVETEDELISGEEKITVDLIHICRSGAWCPPWLDKNFSEFVNSLSKNYETELEEREWNREEVIEYSNRELKGKVPINKPILTEPYNPKK